MPSSPRPNLGKRYGRHWALADCTLEIPAGHVVGLVGPNGAGKSTLMLLAVGLLAPTSGAIEVLGNRPAQDPEQLARVGFVAQDTPVYESMSVADHLRLGAWLNPSWDRDLAERRIDQLGLNRSQKAGKLSGGQRAQLALTLAIAKRPELLILDEPVASLDPLARREFLQSLMEVVADGDVSVVLSSHLIADLERVCDYLIVLVRSHVRLTGSIDELAASHYLLTGPRSYVDTLPPNLSVIESSQTERQATLIVRGERPILDPAWTVEHVGLEDMALAYMREKRERRIRSAESDGGVAVIRLTWLQFRLQTIVALFGLGVVAVIVALTGPHLAHLYDADVAPCLVQAQGNAGSCGCHRGLLHPQRFTAAESAERRPARCSRAARHLLGRAA